MSFYMASKYKNVQAGDTVNHSFDDINFSKSDSTLVAASQEFVAFVIQAGNGGSFIYMHHEKTGRVNHDMPKVCAHGSEITDLAFYPFATNIVATCSADSSVKIWSLPMDGLTSDMTECLRELSGHQRKVTCLLWHPTTENMLVTGGNDHYCCLWNVSTGDLCCKVEIEEAIVGMTFDYNGSSLAAMTRSKKLLVFDPRKNKVDNSIQAHDGTRAYTPIYLKGNKIFTCGTSKSGEREFAMWDVKSMHEPLKRSKYDSNRGQMIPHYEPDHGIIIILGKGETILSLLEVYDDAPYFTFLASLNLSVGGGLRAFNTFPKIVCKVYDCEIIRGLRVNKNSCEIVRFTVPRLAKDFQADLFDKIRDIVPSQTDSKYLQGSNAAPKMLDLRTVTSSTMAKSSITITLPTNSKAEMMDLETRLKNIEKRLDALEK